MIKAIIYNRFLVTIRAIVKLGRSRVPNTIVAAGPIANVRVDAVGNSPS